MKVTKLDAAKRQLDLAIRLYFFNADPVSIHTLALASYNLIKDVNKNKKGYPMLVKEQMLEHVYPDRIKEVIDALNKAENFFKHANRDPEAVLEFPPRFTEFFIWDACMKYQAIVGESVATFTAFLGWFQVNNSHLFKLPASIAALAKAAKAEISQLNKQQYFSTIIPLLLKQGII